MTGFLTEHKLDYFLLNLSRYQLSDAFKFVETYGNDRETACKEYPEVKKLLDQTIALRKLRETKGEDDEVAFMASLCED